MPQLSYEDRVLIQGYLKENHSKRKIWKLLWRDVSVITREILRNWGRSWYNAKLAQVRFETRRKIVNVIVHWKIKRWSELEDYILDWLWNYWSPEQIAWTWNSCNQKNKITTNTIYKFIKKEYPELIKKYYRRWGKSYRRCTEAASYIEWRVSIHKRPKNYKKEFWHFEIDTMRWPWYKKWLVTLTEIKTWLQLIEYVEGKEAIMIEQKIEKIIKRVPEWMIKSITFDNWREFVYHYVLRELYWIETYFCDPWNPRQRALNEYTNWLNRQFFPKWWDWESQNWAPPYWNWEKVDKKYFEKVEKLINNRPRKKLNFLSPIQYLEKNWIILGDNYKL